MGCLGLTGCGFFVNDTSTTGATGSSTTGDYVYAVNTTANTLSGYAIGTGALTAVTGSPIALETGLGARSVVVTPGNGFVYVGGNGAIDCFAIGTGGVLTAVAAGRVTATANFISLTASVDGKWLLGLDSTTQAIYVYGVNTSTGVLTPIGGQAYTSPGATAASVPQVAPTMLAISPSSNVVAAALGTAGFVVFQFNDSTGVLSQQPSFYTPGFSDNAVTFDPTSADLFIARTTLSAGTSYVAGYTVSAAAALALRLRYRLRRAAGRARWCSTRPELIFTWGIGRTRRFRPIRLLRRRRPRWRARRSPAERMWGR